MNCCISRPNSSSVTADDGPGDGAVEPPQARNHSPGVELGATPHMSEIPASLGVLLFAGLKSSETHQFPDATTCQTMITSALVLIYI
jgi:hypothetical protein